MISSISSLSTFCVSEKILPDSYLRKEGLCNGLNFSPFEEGIDLFSCRKRAYHNINKFALNFSQKPYIIPTKKAIMHSHNGLGPDFSVWEKKGEFTPNLQTSL